MIAGKADTKRQQTRISTNSTLRVAIVSDLHVFGEIKPGAAAPSWLPASASAAATADNPLAHLKQLIDREAITADILIVPGDITNAASNVGLTAAWRFVQEIKAWLKAKELFATVGNHDLDSRGLEEETGEDFDPKGNVLLLHPPFPYDHEHRDNKYWARNFCITQSNDVTILNINSCAFHGYLSEKQTIEEYKHGRISSVTRRQIEQELQTLSKTQINIVLMHHHPLQHKEFKFDDHEAAKGGTDLVKMIEAFPSANWIIIHGHRHAPNMMVGPGGSTAPYIFSAGSFSVSIDTRILKNCENQFYVVEFDLDETRRRRGGIYGTIDAWTWSPSGWFASPPSSKIPMKSGFGVRAQPHELAQRIYDHISKMAPPFTTVAEITNDALQELRFVLPRDIKLTLEHLKDEFQVRVTINESALETSQVFRPPAGKL
ncbi:metallophosphoesterase family protein [Bradyrhizobium stylosanthis]|uniref:3',5'-cyclic AMP phosphodiesterase CpdA n=1 Tax=Bradyrhizobium stylosanthis TaxID=1803665 RepID=A0A560D539_9BRAD|nr:metallophosphoesterase [Bradyrhizobium stylosanthis]TWA92235.1 3',5'-cyclic AMP phosphodiesterase CpdA [Bradyrhizobium stylosanthis]